MLNKTTLQEMAVKSLVENKRVALQWATGVGKGYTAVKAIKEIKPTNVLIVVAETAHKKNWAEEIEKAGGVDFTVTQITIECYASLKKYSKTSWDMVILDEAHHVGSDIRLEAFSSMKCNMILVLSATLDVELLQCLDMIFGKFISIKIGIQESIDEGYLPEPKICLIPLELDYIHRTETIEESWGKSAKRNTIVCQTMKESWSYRKNKKMFPNTKLIIKCTEYEKYHYLTEQMDFWMKRYISTRQEVFKTKALQLGSKRKAYLGGIKTPYVLRLMESLKSKRYICFCTDILQADVLGGDNAIHSKKSNNQQIIDAFNDGKKNSLFAVGMAQEGMNLNDIQAGVIVQLDGKERAFIQKFGRTLRAKNPVQYIFYYKFTQDEKWLNNDLEGIDKKFISEYKL